MLIILQIYKEIVLILILGKIYLNLEKINTDKDEKIF